MKDGYYLSTYLHIDETASILEIAIRHDQNLSLWFKEGEHVQLVHCWELERISGIKKYNTSFYNIAQAKELINDLLSTYNLTLNDMQEVWGTPQLESVNDYHSLFIYQQVSYHSIAHLFSTIMQNTDIFYNENIIGLAVDGAPDNVIDRNIHKKKHYAGCVVKNGEIEVFPVFSPAPLWMYASSLYKLREGTLMAIASASTSRLYRGEDDLILVDDASNINKAYEYITNIQKEVDSLTDDDAGVRFSGFDKCFSVQENKISMVMKEVQSLSIRIMEHNLDEIISRHHINPADTYLALSGGFALNCPTNTHLMKNYKFKGFLGLPCVSDTGQSLGIGLYAFYKKMSRVIFKLGHAYYGNDDNSLKNILGNSKYSEFIRKISDLNFQEVVEDIISNPIVWFDGRSEIGPRALGHRSILADPRNSKAKDLLNKYKERQWWRPVAPIVLNEYVNEWFEEAYSSPFMLHAFKVRAEKVESVPAICHIDHTARIQTLTLTDEPRLHQLIQTFYEVTGIPILCNTSLNDKEEPIIDKIDEAINFALRKKSK